MSDKERPTIQCDGRGGILERTDDRPLSHRIVVGGQEVGVSNGARRHIAEQLGLAPSDGSPLPEGLDWPSVDGEPVMPGDVLWDESGNRREVRSVNFITVGCAYLNMEDGTSWMGGMDSFTRTEPPKPVLDRDGVPIDVGDTVYVTGCVTGSLALPYEVVDTHCVSLSGINCVKVYAEYENGTTYSWFAPDRLTHRRPLKTADGELIDVGRVYYGDTDGVAWRVLGFDGPKGLPVRCVKDGGNAKRDLKPEWLHAERPESWERLEEDVGAIKDNDGLQRPCAYFGLKEFTCNRCPVGATEPCNRAMALDIVRRAKALAGVVGDE